MRVRYGNRATMLLIVALTSLAVIAQTSDDRNPSTRSMLPELKQPEIIIRKEERVLEVYDGAKLVKKFTMVLGFAPAGDKEVEGDGKTPEGEFYVFTRNDKSRFHLSLGLSYPSKADAERGLSAGLITPTQHVEITSAIDEKKMPPQKTALGGEIYIHGGGVESDWTWGCIALRNEEIEQLFRVIPVGTKVTILP